jgi:hypothetical protein
MIEIAGHQYELVEITARKYQALIDRMEKEYGEAWQSKGGMKVAVLMLAASAKHEDGSFYSEDELWDLPMSTLNRLSSEATRLNGLGADSQVQEKN